MTARLILCPPTAAALDRLNDCRELRGKIVTLERRHGGGTATHRTLVDRYEDACAAFVDEILAGAVYTEDTDPDQDQTCQFPGCTAWATHRSVTSAGYKRTCGEHFRWDEQILPAQEASDGE